MKAQHIVIPTRSLQGELRHDGSKKQLIIICHGFGSSRGNPTLIAIANGLNAVGYSTFLFNFSKNVGGFDIEHQVQDIALVTEYFSDYDEYILLGHSFAALTTAIAAGQLAKIAKLITLNGFFGRAQLGDTYRNSYLKFRAAALLLPTYRKIFAYYSQELQPGSLPVPALVIHADTDTEVMISQSRWFYDRLTGRKHFVTLVGADHGVSSPADRLKVVQEISLFVD